MHNTAPKATSAFEMRPHAQHRTESYSFHLGQLAHFKSLTSASVLAVTLSTFNATNTAGRAWGGGMKRFVSALQALHGNVSKNRVQLFDTMPGLNTAA